MTRADNTENVRMALADLHEQMLADAHKLGALLEYEPLKQPMAAIVRARWSVLTNVAVQNADQMETLIDAMRRLATEGNAS